MDFGVNSGIFGARATSAIGDHTDQDILVTFQGYEWSSGITCKIKHKLITTTVAPPVVKKRSSGQFCADEFRALKCENNLKIKVVTAIFSVDIENFCKIGSARAAAVDGCDLKNAILMPRHRCNRRSKCWIYHGMFHKDPCPGVRKYAQVDYECV